ncbi:resolvase [Chromatiales bacterium (ex Bugula neritina AB1)]|nr:resolvase [Chromatiales bacterium (ex Bugula neritina AB1)]
MAVYAYLRVSTDQQDVDNQRHGILDYCNTHQLPNISFIEDTVSGRKKWRERKIGDLIEATMQTGDTLVVSEISRMARSTLQVLEILEVAAEKNIAVHVVKQNMIFAESENMTSTIMATVLGLAAQIEREFVSQRTKEALAKRKQAGMTLGRPVGNAETVKLDKREAEIRSLLKKQVSKRAIAKIVECSPTTLYEWMKRRGAA